ncbi:LPXTG cell wall anchor domain-containing protein [Clostridium sp. NSJ-49]|uniref:LPXTG cell wall anchor domain-containing protein n=1 Tax=Clostridium hominis TaxID=2763036 RepID=A0ABR7DGZ7_9CLOT|nr:MULTISPECIES: LPXTG cell wall anchor domain-containing protein [Clostridium]MBC5626073.1 LPXTG cell wall anchor domain-containing protein [Clostridium sp. NSJ-49]MBC5630628.1 LPXTG cell wall anchor domain-containing protein [Clostridium hominis]MDU6340689.1 LPXTG cell wall anchor domain-containing protein [Clostridium sp.]
MESVTGTLVAIKISPLFVGIGIIFVIGLGLLLYMKKRNK